MNGFYAANSNSKGIALLYCVHKNVNDYHSVSMHTVSGNSKVKVCSFAFIKMGMTIALRASIQEQIFCSTELLKMCAAIIQKSKSDVSYIVLVKM